MAFEKTGQGMQALLAAKQATKSPLAEHLNFKSAFKQAQLLMMSKQLEAEKERGFQKEQNRLSRESSENIALTGKGLQRGAEGGIEQIAALPQESGLNTKDLFSEFERTGREFGAIRDSYSRLEASGKEPTAAGDLALIFNFMKILDPGSVVRESEFANAAASGALGERFIAVGKKIASGQRLSNVVRADFLKRGKMLFNRKKKQFKQDEAGFRKLAAQNRIDPESFMRELGLAQEIDINSAFEDL